MRTQRKNLQHKPETTSGGLTGKAGRTVFATLALFLLALLSACGSAATVTAAETTVDTNAEEAVDTDADSAETTEAPAPTATTIPAPTSTPVPAPTATTVPVPTAETVNEPVNDPAPELAGPQCSDLGIAMNMGPGAATAGRTFQVASYPSPPGIENALATLIAIGEDRDAPDTYENAINTLMGYYGKICTDAFQQDFGLESEGFRLCSDAQSPFLATYEVTNIPANDPDGGLVAHAWPGVDADVDQVLPAGTLVVTVGDCKVVDDGGVWWDVSAPGTREPVWVNASYLQLFVEAGQPDGPQDSFNLEHSQFECFAIGADWACATLVTRGYSDDPGNSAFQSPDSYLIDRCQNGNEFECVVLGDRGVIISDDHANLMTYVFDLRTFECTNGSQGACNRLLP